MEEDLREAFLSNFKNYPADKKIKEKYLEQMK